MSLRVHELSPDLITSLQPVVPVIAKHDRDLARQLRRAAPSIFSTSPRASTPIREPGARFDSAAGSAGETRSARQVARCRRHVRSSQVGDSLARLDRALAMLWRLAR